MAYPRSSAAVLIRTIPNRSNMRSLNIALFHYLVSAGQ